MFPLPMTRFEDRSPLVVAKDGGWLRAFPAKDGRWRLYTDMRQVSPLFVDLLIGAEDSRFRLHSGIDPLALLRAAVQVVRHGQVVSGGSTLTMQVAKLLDPRPRTIGAKFIEMFRALQLTAHVGRAGILSMWLTLAPFGGDLEGVRVASLAWFGKEPATLTPAEMALLVALPRSPERLRPDLHPHLARAARDQLIDRLAGAGLIDADTGAAARATPVPNRRLALPIHAAHLAERLVAAAAPANGEIVTTVDPDLQDGVERLLHAAAADLPAPVNAAAVVLEAATGTVRAWAGSTDYFDDRRHGMVDHVRAVRSPGSTLKPFVYGLAFDRYLAHPQSIVSDEPHNFADYAPHNFDDGYSGEVTVATALQRSLNLPSVTVLDRLGPVGFVQAMDDAGMTLRLPDGQAPGLPVVLGGVGVSLIDLAAGYGAIAGDGRLRSPRARQDEPVDAGRALLTPAAAGALRSILGQMPKPRGTRPDRDLAYKTGTSFRFKDGWAVGFDGRYVAGVWVGRSDAASCGRACSGAGGAAPILARLFDLVRPTPLHAVPSGSSFSGPAPANLARLDRTSAMPGVGQPAPVRIEFPTDDSLIDVDGGLPVPLRAKGGRLPLRWYVEGAPLPDIAFRRRDTLWRDHALGWNEITVVDADGHSATAHVRLADPSGPAIFAAGTGLGGDAQHGVPERISSQHALGGIASGVRQDQEGKAR